VLVRHASADSTPGNRGRNPFLKFAELLFYEFHESFASLLSIDAVPALAIPFFRMFPCRLPAYTPQSVTPNLSEEIMSTELRNFLSLSYDELEQLNLKAKEQRQNRVAPHKIQEDRIKYLTDEKRIKAVTVLSATLMGRLHTCLDYDKKFLIKSWDNLTFDGSSIRGLQLSEKAICGLR